MLGVHQIHKGGTVNLQNVCVMELKTGPKLEKPSHLEDKRFSLIVRLHDKSSGHKLKTHKK